VSAPFTYPVHSLLERVPYCTAWWGLFFEVEALEDVTITGIFTQSGQYWRERRDLVNVTLFSRLGPASGFETTADGWALVGAACDARLAKANFTAPSNPRYSRLPLDAPIPLAAGETRSPPRPAHRAARAARAARALSAAGGGRGFLVMTTDERGISLRAKHASTWFAGEESDRDECLVLKAGLLPVSEDGLHDAALREARARPALAPRATPGTR